MGQWFHTRIRNARDRLGLSQRAFGKRFGVTQATICNWETRRTEPWNEQREAVLATLAELEAELEQNKTRRRRASSGPTFGGPRTRPRADEPANAHSARRQVFIAYSYRLYDRDDYRRAYRALEDQYEVTFIFADEKITNMHIMKKIETFIRGSDFSVFDISGWNPNVTLELGFAMGASNQWYIALDPSKTAVAEVPSDLRGLDRIEYRSYSELEAKLTVLMEQRYPKRRRATISDFMGEKRSELLEAIREHPGLGVTSLAQLIQVEVAMVQLILRPLVDEGFLETRGVRKGTKYYLTGKITADAV